MSFNTLIIMNEDAPGYGQRSRSPSGYCKLSMPNRLTCYVQGLRQLPKGQTYRLYLMSKAKEESVAIGRFEVGESRKKEVRWTIDPANINNSKITAKEIDGALILIEGEDASEFKVSLVGFAREPYSWINMIKTPPVIEQVKAVSFPKTADNKVVAELDCKVADNKVVAELDCKVADKRAADELGCKRADNKVADELECERVNDKVEDENTFNKQIRDIDSAQIIEDLTYLRTCLNDVVLLREEVERLSLKLESFTRGIYQDISNKVEEEFLRCKVEQENQNEGQIEDQYVNKVLQKLKEANQGDCLEDEAAKYEIAEKRMNQVFKESMPINPFEKPDATIKWVRITQSELISFPHIMYKWATQPLLTNSYNKYKHFILGQDERSNQYYLGIPDIFHPNKRDILDIEKIEGFHCCRNIPPRVGEHGYWIATL